MAVEPNLIFVRVENLTEREYVKPRYLVIYDAPEYDDFDVRELPYVPDKYEL